MNIKDQFIAGIANGVLQTEILARANQLTTLDAIVEHAEAFETAQRDQSTLTGGEQDPSNVYGVRERRDTEDH